MSGVANRISVMWPGGCGMLCQLAPPSVVRTIAGHDAPLPDRQSAEPTAQPSCVPTKVMSESAKFVSPTGLPGGFAVPDPRGGGVEPTVGVGAGADCVSVGAWVPRPGSADRAVCRICEIPTKTPVTIAATAPAASTGRVQTGHP